MNAYIDGSILIHIGGVEIGQGLYTKMIQIASRVLGIPVESIHIKETNTSVIPNPTDTAASSTSDVFGMAVKVSLPRGRGIQIASRVLGIPVESIHIKETNTSVIILVHRTTADHD